MRWALQRCAGHEPAQGKRSLNAGRLCDEMRGEEATRQIKHQRTYDDEGDVSAVFRLVSCDLGGKCAATHIYSTVERGAFGDDDVIGREVTVHRS